MKVKEIFYSLQGEGYYTGRPAIFVRFSGCNLNCPFCDTDFKEGTEMTVNEIIIEANKVGWDCNFIVLTGGEPTLQITNQFIEALHREGYYVALETNGTKMWPTNINWVTISPKETFCGERAALHKQNPIASEVKVVYDGTNEDKIERYGSWASRKYIQPCDTGDNAKNEQIVAKAVEWLKKHPDWRLSLQTQKIINVR